MKIYQFLIAGAVALSALPAMAGAQEAGQLQDSTQWAHSPAGARQALATPDPQPAPPPAMTIDERHDWWVAIHHSPDHGLHTDLCIAGAENEVLMVRADADSLQMRSADDHWTLTPGSTGDMTVRIGAYQHVFHMQANDATTLSVDLKPKEMAELLNGMERGQQATVQYGERTVVNMTLTGSAPVLDRFRGCAETNHFADLGHAPDSRANPF
ncbi:hypothetical protein [Gluconacetobacter entanii]|uniref:Uncharacterized protein n=1 Tax=Gluconacetobacter entanii TaxID=108528 RepID=A0A318PVJ3_9PROT|nr:hypothetical protein [Gluconacetobacter entanii]PYD63178.1 hypothetical protein CFR72_08330 [Gluconacetobacter entanii]